MIDEGRHYNSKPDMVFETIDDLRSEMTRLNAGGDSFLDYLITGQYSEGKEVWVNDGRAARQFYNALLEVNPHLACESPFGAYFRQDGVRRRGENRVLVRNLACAPPTHRTVIETHQLRRMSGEAASIALFSGGPSAKVSALLCTLPAAR